MSHTVTFYLENTKQTIINTCETSICLLNNAINQTEDSDYKEFLLERIKEINEKKTEALSNPSVTSDINLLKKLDKLAKDTTNVVSTLSSKEFIFKKYDAQQNTIKSIIIEYGIIGKMAIESLENQNKSVNEQTLIQEIELIRNNRMNDENIKNKIKELNDFIDSQKFDNSDLVYHLKSMVRDYKSPQEFADANAFVLAKRIEISKIDSLKEILFEGLKESNYTKFNLVSTELIHGIISKTFKAQNTSGNSVVITINGDGSIRYKLGNYIGHACEKTTERLLQYLEKNSIVVKHTTITRDIDNSKPMYMAAKMKRTL